MILFLLSAVTIPVFAIAFFCLLPAYIFNRQGVRESLLLLEDDMPGVHPQLTYPDRNGCRPVVS